MIELWEEHVADEFVVKDAQATIKTMGEDAYVNHVPIYWDQASVLKQIGLLNDPALPVFGVETAEKVLNPQRQAKEELV